MWAGVITGTSAGTGWAPRLPLRRLPTVASAVLALVRRVGQPRAWRLPTGSRQRGATHRLRFWACSGWTDARRRSPPQPAA